MFAMGQRDAGIGGAGDGGGDAGHHFVADAVRTQRLQFLAAAAEHERVAALQPHHALAGLRERDQLRIDLGLRVAAVAGMLADADAFRIATRQLQHLVADQAVVQDHVGFVQHAQCAQGQQAGIAGAGTDQRDRASCCRRFVFAQRGIERALGGQVLAFAQQALQRALQQFRETAPAFAEFRPACADALAMPGQQFRQRAEAVVEAGFQFLAQQPRQHRRAAAAGDRDLQRAAFDAGGHVETRQLGIVHCVGEDPSRIGGVDHGAVGLDVVRRGDHQPGGIEPLRCERAFDVFDARVRFPFGQRRFKRRCADHDTRAGLEQGFDLAPRDRAAADHQHAAAAQVGEQGKQVGRGGVRHAATLGGEPTSGEMAAGFSLMLGRHKACVEKPVGIGILHRYISI